MISQQTTAASRGRATSPPPATNVSYKRIYDSVEPGDGHRVLIDHVWPRGASRERAALDAWMRDLAPGDELRRWFDHDPQRFAAFRARYRTELLERPAPSTSSPTASTNNAVVFAELLRDG